MTDWTPQPSEGEHTLPTSGQPWHDEEWQQKQAQADSGYGDSLAVDYMHLPLAYHPERGVFVGQPGQSHLTEEVDDWNNQDAGIDQLPYEQRGQYQGAVNVIGNQYSVHWPDHPMPDEAKADAHQKIHRMAEESRHGAWEQWQEMGGEAHYQREMAQQEQARQRRAIQQWRDKAKAQRLKWEAANPDEKQHAWYVSNDMKAWQQENPQPPDPDHPSHTAGADEGFDYDDTFGHKSLAGAWKYMQHIPTGRTHVWPLEGMSGITRRPNMSYASPHHFDMARELGWPEPRNNVQDDGSGRNEYGDFIVGDAWADRDGILKHRAYKFVDSDKDVDKQRALRDQMTNHFRAQGYTVLPPDAYYGKVAGKTRAWYLQRAAELPEDTSHLVHQFPDGWSIRKPKTMRDVGREGVLMNNCWKDICPTVNDAGEELDWNHPDMALPMAEGGYVNYSLRDPDNLPHTSFYLNPDGMVDEALGRHNSIARPEHLQRIGEAMNQEVAPYDSWGDGVVADQDWAAEDAAEGQQRAAAYQDDQGTWQFDDEIEPPPTGEWTPARERYPQWTQKKVPPTRSTPPGPPPGTFNWLDREKPGEIHGLGGDCVNPKCDHSYTAQEQHQLAQYGEMTCPSCGKLQNNIGQLGGAPSDEEYQKAQLHRNPVRAGISLTKMGQIGEAVVKRMGQLPCGPVERDLNAEMGYNAPVDFICGYPGKEYGVEVKSNHSEAQPRFKLSGSTAKRQRMIEFCHKQGLRQGFCGVRLNFYNDKADVFWREGFTDTWYGDTQMQHIGTYDFSDLNPFRQSDGSHHVPANESMPDQSAEGEDDMRRVAMGLNGDLPEGLRFSLRATGIGSTMLEAFVGDQRVGYLTADKQGTISDVEVAWPRRGIATAMMQYLDQHNIPVRHDWGNLSGDAEAWIEKTYPHTMQDARDEGWYSTRGHLAKSGADHAGAMVALYLPGDTAKELHVEGGEPAKDMHITLAFFEAKAADEPEEYWAGVKDVVEAVAREFAPLHVTVSGLGRFNGDDDDDFQPLIGSIDCMGLAELHLALKEKLGDEYPLNTEHGWNPHVTIKYIDRDADDPNLQLPVEFDCDTLSLMIGGDRTDFEMTGEDHTSATVTDPAFYESSAARTARLARSQPVRVLSPGEYRTAGRMALSDWKDKNDYHRVAVPQAGHHCGDCGAFNKGHCSMFDAKVDNDFTCNEWVSEDEWRREQDDKAADKAISHEAAVRDMSERHTVYRVVDADETPEIERTGKFPIHHSLGNGTYHVKTLPEAEAYKKMMEGSWGTGMPHHIWEADMPSDPDYSDPDPDWEGGHIGWDVQPRRRISKTAMAQPVAPNQARQLTRHVESLALALGVPVNWDETSEGGGFAHMDSIDAPPIKTDTDYLVALHELGHHALYRDADAMAQPGADWSIDHTHDPPLDFDETNMDEEARSWDWAVKRSMIPVTPDMMADARASIGTYETPLVKRRGPTYDNLFGKTASDFNFEDTYGEATKPNLYKWMVDADGKLTHWPTIREERGDEGRSPNDRWYGIWSGPHHGEILRRDYPELMDGLDSGPRFSDPSWSFGQVVHMPDDNTYRIDSAAGADIAPEHRKLVAQAVEQMHPGAMDVGGHYEPTTGRMPPKPRFASNDDVWTWATGTKRNRHPAMHIEPGLPKDVMDTVRTRVPFVNHFGIIRNGVVEPSYNLRPNVDPGEATQAHMAVEQEAVNRGILSPEQLDYSQRFRALVRQHARHLEHSYQTVHDWKQAGGGPDHLAVPLLNTQENYLTALHELGHVALGHDVTPKRQGRDWITGSPEDEQQAWQWAQDQMHEPLTPESHARMHEGLGSYTAKTSMADRTGHPEIDNLIEQFLKQPIAGQEDGWEPGFSAPTIDGLRHPENSHGSCQEISEQFAEFAKQHGFEAYVTNTDVDEMGYKPTGPGGEIGFDENDEMQYGHYPEHTIVTIVVDDPDYHDGREFYIDFTASQYGYTDHPKVTSAAAKTASLTPEEMAAVEGVYEQSPLFSLFPDKRCFETSRALHAQLGWPQESGYYRGDGHYWNRKPDGTIVDAAHDQFDEDEPIRVIPPGDPGQGDYQSSAVTASIHEAMPWDQELIDRTTYQWDENRRALSAWVDGQKAAEVVLEPYEDGEVKSLNTWLYPRHGLATALFQELDRRGIPYQHSYEFTHDGKDFYQALHPDEKEKWKYDGEDGTWYRGGSAKTAGSPALTSALQSFPGGDADALTSHLIQQGMDARTNFWNHDANHFAMPPDELEHVTPKVTTVYPADSDDHYVVDLQHPSGESPYIQRPVGDGYQRTAKTAAGQVMYHVAPKSARESIAQHGLNAEIAPAHTLLDNEGHDQWPRGQYLMEQHPGPLSREDYPMMEWDDSTHDVYAVDPTGLELEDDPYGQVSGNRNHLVRQPIGPERVRLVNDGTTAKTADWHEDEHPRNPKGEFTVKEGQHKIAVYDKKGKLHGWWKRCRHCGVVYAHPAHHEGRLACPTCGEDVDRRLRRVQHVAAPNQYDNLALSMGWQKGRIAKGSSHQLYEWQDANGVPHTVAGYGNHNQERPDNVRNLRKNMNACMNGQCQHLFSGMPTAQPSPEVNRVDEPGAFLLKPGTKVQYGGKHWWVMDVDGGLAHIYDETGQEDIVPQAELRAARLRRVAGEWYEDPDKADWQHGLCDTYARALIDMHPHLRFGVLGQTYKEGDGWVPQHYFAHDDQYAYDSLGRHPLPYHGIDNQMDASELNLDPDDWTGPHGENGGVEEYERAKALIPGQHPWLQQRTAAVPNLTFKWEEGENRTEVLVASVEGQEVGHIQIDKGRIYDVDVRPEWRRQGIATALYQEAQKEWGQLEHGLLTDDGKAWAEAVEPGGTYAPNYQEPDYWERSGGWKLAADFNFDDAYGDRSAGTSSYKWLHHKPSDQLEMWGPEETDEYGNFKHHSDVMNHHGWWAPGTVSDPSRRDEEGDHNEWRDVEAGYADYMPGMGMRFPAQHPYDPKAAPTFSISSGQGPEEEHPLYRRLYEMWKQRQPEQAAEWEARNLALWKAKARGQRTAMGMNGDLPEGLTFRISDGTTGKVMDAMLGGQRVGRMELDQSGRVEMVRVEDEYQRMGVATAMWQEFERQGIQPQHSDEKTQSGTAWANAVDGNPKDDMDNYTDWMGDVFGSVRTAEAYDADPLESQGKPAFDFENVFGENQPDDDGTRHFKYLWPDPNPGEKDGERHVWEVNGLDGYPWHNQVLTELYGRPNVSGYHKGMARLLANGVMDDYYGNRLPLAEEAHIREKFGIETNL